MKSLLWTKSNKLRVLIATMDDRLFAECKNIINHVSRNCNFKLQLYSLKTCTAAKGLEIDKSPISLYDSAMLFGRLAGIPTIKVRQEDLYVDALAVRSYCGANDFALSPYEICKQVTEAQEKDPAIKRRAHIEQTVVLFDTNSDDIYAPTRQLWGTIALCEGMPLNYIQRGRYDTIFIPNGVDGTLATNLKWKDIGHIAGKPNITTPLYRALHDIYFYLQNQFQPF